MKVSDSIDMTPIKDFNITLLEIEFGTGKMLMVIAKMWEFMSFMDKKIQGIFLISAWRMMVNSGRQQRVQEAPLTRAALFMILIMHIKRCQTWC